MLLWLKWVSSKIKRKMYKIWKARKKYSCQIIMHNNKRLNDQIMNMIVFCHLLFENQDIVQTIVLLNLNGGK